MTINRKLQFITMMLFAFVCLPACSPAKQQKDKGTEKPNPTIIREAKIKTALSFINAYVANCNKVKQAVDLVKWTNSSDLATPAFKKELKRMDEEARNLDPVLGLESDPIFDAQDYPDKGFELERYNEHSDYIILKGINWPEFKLCIKIIDVNGKYLVDGCGMINIPEDKKIPR